ncbi:M23 family metallopeptidase [Microlunatus soli]|uniref:M23 family metallopeptidase n=1 Tax=Microlunatus soli TaxID=630515 RepID=UPI000B830838|nr:M23 family metallopeptidase [Microlunatus soli]
MKTSAKAFGTTQSKRARRAAREVSKDKRGWLRHGIAAMAIAGLGLAGAGAVAVTGSANESGGSAPGVSVASKAIAGNAIGSRDSDTTSRSTQRQDLGSEEQQVHHGTGEPMDGTVDMTARRDAQKNAKVTDTSAGDDAATKAAQERAKELQADALKAQELSGKLSKEERDRKMEEAEKAAAAARAAQSQSGGQGAATGTTGGAASTDDSTGSASTDTSSSTDSAASDDSDTSAASTSSSGSATTPVAKGAYSIAATFGQYGSWSRYHTGVDFSAPIGTPIHAPGDGTITNAGMGSASGWAGNYVVVKFANGDQMLMAHMSSVSVSNGQHVSAGQVIGHVGMTGRAFGPHTHVEFYPKGITPGDVYSAKDPISNYFSPHGVKVS